MKVIPLHLEVGDIYIIKEEAVISLRDVASVSPVPGPNSIFKWDSSNEFLCQLSQNVHSILFCTCRIYHTPVLNL